MRIVLISGVETGLRCAEALLKKKAGLVGIFCYPDSLRDRSGYADFAPLGREYGVPVHKPEDINSPGAVEEIRSLAPDIILVIGWSMIIGDGILAVPRKGALGHHPTLLPKHRGNAPIPWTLINGLARTGVTFFFLEKEIDAGAIAGQKEFAVSLDDDAGSLYRKMTDATVELLLELLPKISKGTLRPTGQDSRNASRWPRRRPEDGVIDWNTMALCLYNWIRGLSHPYPGAFTFLGKDKVYVWKAALCNESGWEGKPGTVVSAGGRMIVMAGDGPIRLEKLQVEGGGELPAAEFCKRHGIEAGARFG